jgi:hypothetical protein
MTDRANTFFAPLRSLRLASGRLRLLREIILAQGLRAGNFGAASPLQAPPSAVPAATSPSSFDRLRIDREDLAYLASTDLGFPVGIPVKIAIPPKQVSLAM